MSKKFGVKNSLLHLEILADHPLLNYRGTDNQRGAFSRSSFVRYRLWLRLARLYVTNKNILYQYVLRAEGARKIIAFIIVRSAKIQQFSDIQSRMLYLSRDTDSAEIILFERESRIKGYIPSFLLCYCL